MDKTKIQGITVTHRRGFALMVTFSVLLIIIALTMVLLSYFKEVQHDSADTTAMIQADVYYADITSVFDKFKKKNTLFSTLYRFPVPLRSPDGRFQMMLRCQPLSNGVNVNWLAQEGQEGMRAQYTFAQTLFDTLAQEYDLEDASRLQEMLAEATGGKEKFVKKSYSRLRQKNGIISYQQFAQIVSRYQLEVDDPKASRIPWKKYFTFSSNAAKIDAEYASPELISLLFDIDLQSVRDWFSDPQKGSLKSFVNNNGGNYASRQNIIVGKKFLEQSECMVSFSSGKRPYQFKFKYILGEAKHFEFYGKR
ncbi:MAG TPA: hypothetical protein ENK39_01040 [Epsilonproteobacteria bacterium]|nr:hypothetical protein [Campylobacterota bacterium]